MAINWHKVPEDLRPALQRYIEHGIPPGSFLEAVLTNNLMESFARADQCNRNRLFDIVKFLCNEVPILVWGSRENLAEHIARKKAERQRWLGDSIGRSGDQNGPLDRG